MAPARSNEDRSGNTADPDLTPLASRLSPPVRLWAPWRMRYVGGGASEEGCLFCNRLAADDDVASLLVHRAERTFVILNLFPYNTAHLMLVPNAHVASPEEAPAEALAELALVLRSTLRALRRALGCHGFNVGFNVGAVAGAGVAEHLHQHVVPRWTGDANFMPILASTMVLPELLPVTYAKVRAELERELLTHPVAVTPSSSDPCADPPNWEDPTDDPDERAARSDVPRPDPVKAVVLTPDLSHLLIAAGGEARLPAAVADPQEAVWRAAVRAAGEVAGGLDLAGWAGQTRAVLGRPWALTLLTADPDQALRSGDGRRWIETARSDEALPSPFDRAAVRQALAHLAPGIAAP